MRKQKNDDDQALLKVLGSKLREYRKLHNLSQEDLAYISGIDRHTISNIENGKDDAGYITLYRLVNSLNTPTELLFLPSDDERSKLIAQIIIDVKDSGSAELEMFHRFLEAYRLSAQDKK